MDKSDKVAALAALLEGFGGKVDPAELARLVREEVQRQTVPLVVKLDGRDVPTFEGLAHEAVPRVLELVARGFTNIYLWGPPGTGKTTIAECVAKALARPMDDISMSAGVTEFHWTGRMAHNVTDGTMRFIPTGFTELVGKPSIYLVDEADHSDPNAIAKLNMFLANGRIKLANGETLNRSPDNVLLLGANTSGRGGDRANTAASALTASFLDRFTGAVVYVGYDKALERKLVAGYVKDSARVGQVCAEVWRLRDNVADKLRGRYIGTRAVIAAAKHVAHGDSIDRAVERLLVDWTREERALAKGGK